MLSCYNFNLPQQFCALKKDGSNNGDLWSIEIFTPKYSTYRNIRVGDPPALIIEGKLQVEIEQKIINKYYQ